MARGEERHKDMHDRRQIRALGLALLATGGCVQAGAIARLSPAAVSPMARVERIAVSEALVTAGSAGEATLTVEAQLTNGSGRDARLDAAAVALVLHANPSATVPSAVLRVRAVRPGGLAGPRAELPAPAVVLPPGTSTVAFEFDTTLVDDSGLAQRAVLRLGDGRAEVVLADPTTNQPRWQVAPARVSGMRLGTGVLMVSDQLAVCASLAGSSWAVGPIVLQDHVDVILGDSATGAGLGLELRAGWPVALGRPRGTARRWFALAPWVGGRSMVATRISAGGGGDFYLAPEVGISLLIGVDRTPRSPFPIVRPPSPTGSIEVSLGYVHWFATGLGARGVPGMMTAVSFALF
jgi:hypothetical protein